MRIWKSTALLTVCLVLVLALLPATAKAAATSGTCGDNLTWILDNGTLTITGTGPMADYDEAPWYKQRKTIKTVLISDGVTAIGKEAFYDCGALETVTLPATLQSIGEVAFCGCIRLEQITIPSGVKTIQQLAFANCIALRDVTLREGLTEIGNYAFNGCKALTEVTLPDSVNSVGEHSFYNCEALQTVTVGSGLETIGVWAFSRNSALTAVYVDEENPYYTDIDGIVLSKDQKTLVLVPGAVTGSYTIPAGIKTVGDRALAYCTALTEVTVGSSVNIIGTSAFRGCSSLEKVTIDKRVSVINEFAFYGCDALAHVYYNATWDRWTDIDIKNSNAPLQDAAWHGVNYGSCGENATWTLDDDGTLTITGTGETDAYSLEGRPWCEKMVKKVVIEAGITAVGDGAFWECKNLTQVQLPAGLTKLGDFSFYKCSALKTITIPKGVVEIGAYAFCECTELETVTIPSTVNKIEFNAFDGCAALTDVYYSGTQQTWDAVDVGKKNEWLLEATLHFAIPGDVDSSGELTTDDAVYLLLAVMFGEGDYPLPAGSTDFDGDSDTDTDDAVYLLLHVMFGEGDYPLSAA